MDKRKIETKGNKPSSAAKPAAPKASAPKASEKSPTAPGDPIHSAVDGSYQQAVPANQNPGGVRPGQPKPKTVVNKDTSPREAALNNSQTPAGFPVLKQVPDDRKK